MKRFITALAAAVLATAAPAFADTMSAPATMSMATPAPTSILDLIDRPTTTQSTYVVAPDHVLIEAGYNNTTYKGQTVVSTYPQVLVRIGTELKGLEVFAKAPSEVRIGTTSASDDVQAGVKYLLRNAKRYAVSAQLGVDVPTGTLGNSGSQTSFALNGTYKISQVFAVKTTQTLTAQNFGGIRYGSYTPSFVVSAALPYKVSIFGEYALATKANGPGTSSRSRYLLGASHAISNRLAVDVEGTTSPAANNVAKYTGIGFGAAYQL